MSDGELPLTDLNDRTHVVERIHAQETMMIRSILIGLVAGQRSMMPLAVLASAAWRETLPYDTAEARLMHGRLPAAVGIVMALAEVGGDKMASAPDRTVFLGRLARMITGGFSGAALAPQERRLTGAALGIGAALGSSYLGLAIRKWAIQRWGQSATGFVEDAFVLSMAMAVANGRDRSVKSERDLNE